jgi:hypothetical protein
MTIYDFINTEITSKDFINYCDDVLYNLSEEYVSFLQNEYRSRLSISQIKGLLKISQVCTEQNKIGILKDLTSNRNRRETNPERKEIWDHLKNIVDIESAKDTLKDQFKNYKTPKEYIKSINYSQLTDKEQKEAKKIIFNNLMSRFFEHFCIHHSYLENISKGKR